MCILIVLYNTAVYSENPFTFGNLALDDAFVDREQELEALLADLRSGQDVLLVAPRRYGKSSLALRAVQAKSNSTNSAFDHIGPISCAEIVDNGGRVAFFNQAPDQL